MSGNQPTKLKKTIREMEEELMAQQRGTAAHVSPFARGAEIAYQRSLHAPIQFREATAADLERIRSQQEPQPAQRAYSPPRASGMMSATLARQRAYENYIAYYRNLEQQYRAVPGNERSYLDALEEQQRREQQRREQQRQEEEWQEQRQQRQQQQESRRPRSRSRSPDNKEEAFAILGIPSTSSKIEIQKAYRRQALLLHPDKNRHNIEEATTRFQQLQAAMDEINKEPQRGGIRRYRLHHKLKTRSHRHSHHHRYNRLYHKRLRKSCKSSKTYSNKNRR
uniref:J domain-containing protein n=1 Tax=viral metagenome TaxID=1070528 RepID=A0A6C0EZN9_9ZZZZ